MSGLYGLSCSTKLNNDIQRREAMMALCRRVCLKGWLYRMWLRVKKQSSRLLNLAEMEQDSTLRNSRKPGVQAVPIDQIKGSEERSDEFDVLFTPLCAHLVGKWIDLAVAYSKRIDLPPVELIQVDDYYFVRDGHHRISVARAFGQEYIDAVVIARRVTDVPVAPAVERWANRQAQELRYIWQSNVSMPKVCG